MYTLIDGVQFYDKDEVDGLFAHNGFTGLSDRIDQEAVDRATADDGLGARIDQEAADRADGDREISDKLTQESNIRLLGDQTLANQLTAIEQLWSTLISANFIDTDNNSIVSDDSGKSIRQIAHDEFYRQLIADADDVKQQLDTLKELADYLQNNPTVLSDMYTKLGITWSPDNPTDFGAFDFSGVLSADNVDDAILELHNLLTTMIGDLTQLTTTFKGNIVGAINELDAEIGDLTALNTVDKGTIIGAINSEFEWRQKNDEALGTRIDDEATARTDADTALGTRIDDEATARTDADTALGTRIDDEATARTDADTALGTRIDDEATARTDADTALGTRIDDEATARTDADTALGTRIDDEATARTDADTALGTRIDDEVGDLSQLTTTEKGSVVAAINEVNGKFGSEEVDEFDRRAFLAAHPISSLYWTSDPRNPGAVYGGVWQQIKDMFVLACGDRYTVDVIGGNADTSLIIANLPSHTHGLNNHTHSFTPNGTVSTHIHGAGTLATNTAGEHTHEFTYQRSKGGTTYKTEPVIVSDADDYWYSGQTVTPIYPAGNHTHTVTGTTANATPTFAGTAGTTDAASGDTNATGSGVSFSNMPPYIVKYCWERTA